jgi:SAM-dependent methyltransferase
MKTGRDYYANIYASQLDAEAKWLAIGAVEKANSVELLVHPRLTKPLTVMELGAGTGAIIAELQRRKFAANYIAVDYSGEACEYMRSKLHNVTVAQADIVTERIPDKADVVLLSHVIEHLEEPEALLSAVANNVSFEWLVIECPLEDLAISRFKNLIRDRKQNLAGHVQFFTEASLRDLIGRHFATFLLRADLLSGSPCRSDRESWRHFGSEYGWGTTPCSARKSEVPSPLVLSMRSSGLHGKTSACLQRLVLRDWATIPKL